MAHERTHRAASVVSSAPSRRSLRSTKSSRSGRRYEPYRRRPRSVQNLKQVAFLTTENFYKAISRNLEFGRDFLREMDCPLCLSKPVLLPLNLSDVAPGRCLSLSPFGHNLVMEFQCETCARPGQVNKSSTSPPRDDELFSITLAFYNNAGKVLLHKAFYLSLLSQSMDLVRRSFLQPSLLYAFLVIKTFSGQNIVPVFTSGDLGISMYIIFNSINLHINETCIRLLSENMTHYKNSIDCTGDGTYIMNIAPITMELQKINISHEEICEAINNLDYTDEIKGEIVTNTEIIERVCKNKLS